MKTEPRFLVDSMLGKVARWLVMMGYDAAFAGTDGRADCELLAQAQKEGRIFLTRDAKIVKVAGVKVVVVGSQRFESQLRCVFKELGLRPDPKRFFTRCTYCNQALESVPREEAAALVPPLVRDLPTDFWRCSGCQRMYWQGTHTQRAVERIKKLGL
ncbi:MAG: Mut7-C RNAse domain-containing protein [Elusimicrobiota bacterium]|jgi:hypothetical protein